MAAAAPQMAPEVRQLDVSVLHALVFDRLLGIGEAAVKSGALIEYMVDARAALAAVREGARGRRIPDESALDRRRRAGQRRRRHDARKVDLFLSQATDRPGNEPAERLRAGVSARPCLCYSSQFSAGQGRMTQVQKIEIKGFRSLKNVVWEPDRLNVVIGANGSGKSNLLRALELIAGKRGGKIPRVCFGRGRVSTIALGPPCAKRLL